MGEIVVAYAEADAASADIVVSKLEKRGYKVTRSAGRQRLPAHRLNGAASTAPPVLVLWSREYAQAAEPSLLKSARLAVRLDAARPPPLLKAPAVDLRTWRGREDHRGWRKLMSSLGAKPAPPGKKPEKRSAKGMFMTSNQQSARGKSGAIDLSAYAGQGNTLVGTLVWLGVLAVLLGGVWMGYRALFH